MAAETSSPARDPATTPSYRGRGRGGRGGRGRGRGGGRGAYNAAVTKPTAASRGRGGTRRGRVKNFSDSRVQAAYERQRDLKATYQAVAFALKPALQELAERSVDDMLQNPDSYKQAEQHSPVVGELSTRLEDRLAESGRRYKIDLDLAENIYNADKYVFEKEFQNGVDDMMEQFYESQENRLRILAALHSKDLPVDVRDDQYEYKVITDSHLDNDFGIYEAYKNGHLVPYPSRVPGTKMWRKAHKTEAPASGHSGSTRGRGRGRGSMRRRALDQQQADGQTTPKRSARNADDTQLLGNDPIAPAPMKGLLASAANVDEDPEGTPGEEESVPASPEASGVNGTARTQKQDAREKSPPLPKNIGEPDEYGVRSYNQRASLRAQGLNSRFLAPRSVSFEDWEIGFKDSSNDSTKGHTRAKRGKYLDKPNSNGIFFDHWCNGYDFSSVHEEDLDEGLVRKHGLHPQYGIFLPDSKNDEELGDPYDMPGKPIVYIAKPSGRISHASRSYLTTVNQRRSDELPLREKMKANLRRFCKVSDIAVDDIATTDYVESDDALRAKSLRTANKELNSRPQLDETSSDGEAALVTPPDVDNADGGLTSLSVLTYASAFVAAEEHTRSAPAAAKPARYDAIRDVFTDAKPAPAPAIPSGGLSLNFLAELCNVEGRLPGTGSQKDNKLAAAALGMDLRSSVKREEPAAPFNHAPLGALTQEPGPLYLHNQPSDRDRAAPPVGAPASDRQGYPVPGDIASRSDPYKSHTGPPAIQDHASYYPPYPPDPRDGPMAGGRGMDPGYNPRRHSGYGTESSAPPAYSRMYWPQQPQAPPPPPTSMSGGTSSPSHHAYPPPSAPSSSRMSFSQTGGAEPLPPLRPPRSRTQSIADDPLYDSGMRGSMHNSYYPPASSRSYHRGYSASDAHQGPPPLQGVMPVDRILPSPQQSNQPPPFMGSPPPPPPAGYGGPQVLSPTFASASGFGGPMGQSPPGTPHGGPPSSIHRHRSTPSGSSDAGNKYRKLQPAPVPAHRAWSNKPELKTIPYDHKETGSSAALPSSGPTQIRGWNVNQHRKRSKQDKGDSANDRDESR